MARFLWGLVFLLVPLDQPGIEIRPLVMTSGEKIQNQIFFDAVRVPKSNVIGTIDDGWTVATKDRKWTAQFEHTLVVTDDGAEILTLP